MTVFEQISAYPSIHWHIPALTVLQKKTRFLDEKPDHTD